MRTNLFNAVTMVNVDINIQHSCVVPGVCGFVVCMCVYVRVNERVCVRVCECASVRVYECVCVCSV